MRVDTFNVCAAGVAVGVAVAVAVAVAVGVAVGVGAAATVVVSFASPHAPVVAGLFTSPL
jgi:hypothetical protein